MTEDSKQKWSCHAAWDLLWGSGVATIATAAFLFSLGSLSVRFLEPGVPAFQVACIPSIVCLLLTTGLMVQQRVPLIAPSRTVRLLTILRGLFGAASITLFYMSIEMLPLKDAVTLFFCSPVIAVMLEWMVTGDTVNTSAMVGCVFTVLGVFLITQPGLDWVPRPATSMSMGMTVALLAATCNAIAFVIVRALAGRQSALALTWWFHLVVMIVTATSLAFKYPAAPVVPTMRQCALLLSIVAAQFFGQLLLNRGFQLVSATRGSAINVLQVMFSYIWELTVLKEDTNMVSMAGGACVMAGVLAVAASGSPHLVKSTLPQPFPSPSQTGQQEEADQDLTYMWVSGSRPGSAGGEGRRGGGGEQGAGQMKLVRLVDNAMMSDGSEMESSVSQTPHRAYEPPVLGSVVLVVPGVEEGAASGGSPMQDIEHQPLLQDQRTGIT